MSITVSAAAPPTDDLVSKLEEGIDFRVRVQAALQLGKSRDPRARAALEMALDDDNAAVRAAAAAGLKVFGSKDALPALERHRKDPSPAVRSQIESSISTLAAGGAVKSEKAEVLVQMGKIRNGSTLPSGSVEADAERTSRTKIGELPGVEVLAGDGKSAPARGKKAPPVVMVTGRVKQLGHRTQGASLIYSASVEFVMHRMPGQAISSVVSGSARAQGAASDANDREALEDLRKTALEAAITSALRNAPEALRAAAR